MAGKKLLGNNGSNGNRKKKYKRMGLQVPIKEKIFVQNYLKNGLNAPKAAIAAGYSSNSNSASVRASELLKRPSVQELLQEEFAKREVTVDEVFREMANILRFDITKLYDENGRLLEPHELPRETASVISGIDVKELRPLGRRGSSSYSEQTVTKYKTVSKDAVIDKWLRIFDAYRDKVRIESEVKGTIFVTPKPCESIEEWDRLSEGYRKNQRRIARGEEIYDAEIVGLPETTK